MRDPGTEQFLTRAGCKFTYEEAWPLDQIDFDEAERTNMARLGKRYDEKRALAYSQLWEDGVEFPPIIVFRPPTGEPADLCDGLHRGRGAIAARRDGKPKSTIAVYVIEDELNEFRREVVVRASNSWHGIGNTLDQNLAHIGEVFRKWPDATVIQVARMFGVGVGAVKNHLKANEADERGRKLGIDDIMSAPMFTQTLKVEMMKIHNHTAFARVAQTIYDAKLKGKEAETLTADCRKARAEADVATICERKMQEVIDARRRGKAVIGRSPTAVPNTFIGRGRAFVNYPKDGMIKNVHLDGLPASSWAGYVMLMEEICQVATAARDELIRLMNLRDRMRGPTSPPLAA